VMETYQARVGDEYLLLVDGDREFHFGQPPESILDRRFMPLLSVRVEAVADDGAVEELTWTRDSDDYGRPPRLPRGRGWTLDRAEPIDSPWPSTRWRRFRRHKVLVRLPIENVEA
jgi:hypothetical protein